MKYVVFKDTDVFLVRKEMRSKNPFGWVLKPFVVQRSCFYTDKDHISANDNAGLEILADENVPNGESYYIFHLPMNSNNYRFMLVDKRYVLVRV